MTRLVYDGEAVDAAGLSVVRVPWVSGGPYPPVAPGFSTREQVFVGERDGRAAWVRVDVEGVPA